MDASAYAFAHGMRHTRATLRAWQRTPLRVLARWTAGSALAAALLLAAVLLIASLDGGYEQIISLQPPFEVGGLGDVLHVLRSNMLVLALHAMACVAGFIAGSSLPLQAQSRSGVSRMLHQRGGPIAIAVVIGATTFSLSAQALVIGSQAAAVAARLHTNPATLLVVLIAHAPLELTALFLPLAAWISASRRGEWDQLLAATFVTVVIALPMLLVAAFIEVFVSPHILHALIG